MTTINPRGTAKTPVDLLITGGLVLTLNDRDEIFSSGAVGVTGDRIVAVGDASTLLGALQPREVLDARGCLAMPGLINLHTHGAMTCFRGLADDLPLEIWLHEHIFPAESKHMDEDNVYWGTLLAVAEMIRSGTTTFCDGYFCEDGAARAVVAGGIRAVCAQGVIDFPAPGVPDASKNLDTAEQFVRRWQGRSPRLAPSIFCHSPYTCSPETLRRGKALCLEYGVLFQIHVAETSAEVEESLRCRGFRPVAYLKALDLLDSGTICHHAGWVDGYEIDLLAGSGAAVSHNPESNMKLASGVARLPEMLGAGVKVGLGTDGCASNNNLDMLREMDAAAKLHKVHRLDPTVMAARTVVRMATGGGAAALGMAGDLGSLAPGKKADLITIDLDQPHLVPLYEPCSHLVYAARGADVRDAIIDGRVVMRNRELLTVDLERVMAEVRRIGKKIRA
ncbi:MAG TPA: amidohydrolase [Syntrophobacteria bacterium]|nr:amidohydrolase [Syntrophobacteria bacterium]